ncbi:hypothetical protein BHE74_00002544 [Ensete ventricosum]|nr:hypothetical protein GW17_00044460 [Ensete ventricosum]RWW88574.1 hypothetical protein BHE74_00002544 [Ensete ventricosum]
MGSYRCCICFTRKFRWSEAKPAEDVREAFATYAEGGAHMTVDQLRRFLAEAQGEAGATVADAERVMERVRQLRRPSHLAKLSKPPFLTLDDFHYYLFSEELNPSFQPQVFQAEELADDDDDQKERQNAPPEYKRLITIRAGKPKGHMSEALKVDPEKVRRLSLSEQELVKAAATHGADLIRFTQKNLLRIYPKGTRFNSSNYNPFIGWIHGAQMVAFNMQVGIAGVPADTVMKKTKTIEDNWTPVWDEEFTFPLTVPELALLRIEVHEYDMSEKDDFGGQACVPVSEVRPGIRAVPLFDRKGNKFNSVKLLMRFEFV